MAGNSANVRIRFAFTPGVGSNTKTRPARTRFMGSLGVISHVRNSLKLEFGVRLCNFFSIPASHWGAKCTFFSSTHLPVLAAWFIALSACLKPSADPETVDCFKRTSHEWIYDKILNICKKEQTLMCWTILFQLDFLILILQKLFHLSWKPKLALTQTVTKSSPRLSQDLI